MRRFYYCYTTTPRLYNSRGKLRNNYGMVKIGLNVSMKPEVLCKR